MRIYGIKHTILPPPADTTGWGQYVKIDPADPRHAISYWAPIAGAALSLAANEESWHFTQSSRKKHF